MLVLATDNHIGAMPFLGLASTKQVVQQELMVPLYVWHTAALVLVAVQGWLTKPCCDKHDLHGCYQYISSYQ